MYNADFLKPLKQSNISVDKEKTKQRARESFARASNKDKNAIQQLAGIGRHAIYRAYTTGSIGAKLAVAFAQIMDINPRYLTGESDEPGECSDEIVRGFLTAHGYENFFAEQPSTSRKRRGRPAKPAESEDAGQEAAATEEPEEIVVVEAETEPAAQGNSIYFFQGAKTEEIAVLETIENSKTSFCLNSKRSIRSKTSKFFKCCCPDRRLT